MNDFVKDDSPLVKPKNHKCSRCGLFKEETQFYKDKRTTTGLGSWCKDCYKTYQKYDQTKDRKSKLKRKYGVTVEQYENMLLEQNNKCAICSIDACPSGVRFAVDHCHSTGRVRGLLCINCNQMLGKAKDSTETLQRAIEYLRGL